MTLLQTYNVETLTRIDIHYADGLIDQATIQDATSVEDFQEHVKNLYNSNFTDGELDSVVAYDYNGDKMAAITPDEFFGPLGGF